MIDQRTREWLHFKNVFYPVVAAACLIVSCKCNMPDYLFVTYIIIKQTLQADRSKQGPTLSAVAANVRWSLQILNNHPIQRIHVYSISPEYPELISVFSTTATGNR